MMQHSSPPQASPTKFCSFAGPDWGGINRRKGVVKNALHFFGGWIYYIVQARAL
jgi:hypothetical protein